MTKKELYAHPGWGSCTFEGAEMSTLLLGLKSTFREKLEWLEAAETLARNLQAPMSFMVSQFAFHFRPCPALHGKITETHCPPAATRVNLQPAWKPAALKPSSRR